MSDFCRLDFQNRFMELAREEQGRAQVITNKTLQHLKQVLQAHCCYRKHPEVWDRGKPEQGVFCLLDTPTHGIWNYGDGIRENFLERVRLCVAQAGRVLPDFPTGRPGRFLASSTFSRYEEQQQRVAVVRG